MSVAGPVRSEAFSLLESFQNAVDEKLRTKGRYVRIKQETQTSDGGDVQVLRVRAVGKGALNKLSKKQQDRVHMRELVVAGSMQFTLRDCLKEFLKTAKKGVHQPTLMLESAKWLEDGLQQYAVFVETVQHLAKESRELLDNLKTALAMGIHEFLEGEGQLTGDSKVDRELVDYVLNGGQVGKIYNRAYVLPNYIAVGRCHLAMKNLLRRTPEERRAGKIPKIGTREQPKAVKRRSVKRRKSTKRLSKRRSTKTGLRETKEAQEARTRTKGQGE